MDPAKDKLLIGQLYDIFRQSEKEDELIGMEGEKVGVISQTGQPGRYRGKGGYLAILGRLHDELGWEIINQEGKLILEMKRCKTLLSLESDGRIELAGSPHKSIHDLARELRIHQSEITEISKIFGIIWLGIGCQPLSMNRDIEDIMTGRKQQMLRFFERIKNEDNNDFGLAWYKKTSGIHINLDYRSEEDFGRKSKVLFRLAPVLNAMFSNSPFSKRQFTGYMSYRRWLTLNTGIRRFNTSHKLYESDFKYEDWIEYVLGMEVLFLEKETGWIHPNMSFEQLIKKGYGGHHATMNDFNMHLKSAWADVRMRNVIEVRCIDSLPPKLMPSAAALLKGLIYDEMALLELKQLTDQWSFEDYQKLQKDAAKNALQASVHGTSLLNIAKHLIQLAKKSLKKNPILDTDGKDESFYLEPIQEFILIKEKSPAEWLVEKWEGEWNKNFYPVIDWCKY